MSEDRFQKLFKHLKRQWGSSRYFLKIPFRSLHSQVPQYPCSWRAKVSKAPSVAEPDAKGGTQFEPCYHTDWLELKVFWVLQISWHSKLLAERDLTWIITEGKLWCVSQTQGIAGNSSVDVHLRKNKDRTQGEHTAWSRSHKQDSSHNKTHMYSAQGANSSICNQSNSLYERVTLLSLKKKKKHKDNSRTKLSWETLSQ